MTDSVNELRAGRADNVNINAQPVNHVQQMASGHVPQLERQPAFQYPEMQSNHTVDPNIEPEADIDDENDILMWEVLVRKWRKFFENWTNTKKGTPNVVVNRRCYSFETSNVLEMIDDLHHNQTAAYKLQIQLGYVLRDISDNSLEYYFGSSNTSVFDKPILIASDQGISNVANILHRKDIVAQCLMRRPGSSFVFFCPVNLLFFIYPMNSFIRGGPVSKTARNYLKKCPYIFSFLESKIEPYCFFYCLEAFLQNFNVKPERVSLKAVKRHVEKFKQAKGVANFKGVCMGDLSMCEHTFNIGIQVLKFDFVKNSGKPLITTIRHSSNKERCMFLGLCSNHFCLITNEQKLASLYECNVCGQISNRIDNYKTHKARRCSRVSEVLYQTGHFLPKCGIVSLLERIGVQGIQAEDFRDRSVIIYDFEVGLDKVDKDSNLNTAVKLFLTEKHTPISVAVATNVAPYNNAKFLCDLHNPNNLIHEFILYCLKVSEQAKARFERKIDYVYEQLEELMTEFSMQSNQERQRQVAQAEKRLNSYVSRLPVVGFNSACYDLKAIKRYFFGKLLELDGIDFCVKKDGAYLCVASSSLRFLDIAKYLGPGNGGLSAYLSAYGNPQSGGKLFFPYSLLETSKDLMNITEPPPFDSFYSELAGGNTLSIEYEKWQHLLALGVDSGAALSKIGLTKPPNTGNENYSRFQKTWVDYQCSSLLDYLKIYNLADVEPLLLAVENHQNFYFEKNINMLRDHLTLPSLCLPYLFSFTKEEDYFVLLDKEVNQLFRKNLFGGLSVIITRYAKKGVTYIKPHYFPNPQLCRKITCVDSNMLYGSCLGQDMFCGPYIIRDVGNNFKPNLANKGSFTIQFVEYLALKKQMPVRHALTPEGEFSAFADGKLCFADGFFKDDSTWVEVNTCFTHGCPSCFPKRSAVHPLLGTTFEEVYMKSTKRTDSISKAFKVEIFWECDLKKKYHTDSEFNHFCRHICIGGSKISRKSHTETELLSKILDGTFFGALLCSATVPSELEKKFDQFPPIISRQVLRLDDAGEKMKEIANSMGIEKLEREQLVGSFAASDILLSTSMVTWLIAHGVRIFSVKKLIQFTRRQPFKKFTEQIALMRQKADATNDVILSTTAKALGNSSYGFTLYSAERSVNTKFVHEKSVEKYIRSSRFLSMEMLENGFHEVCLKKNSVIENLPIQIGYQVYCLSKTYMLHFVYDVLDKHLKNDHWEILSSDTDSICMVLAEDDIDKCVKHNMMASWLKIKYDYFVDYRTKESFRSTSKKPLLFKEEIASAESFYGLNAKCTYASTNVGPKVSAKGVNKKQNILTEDMFHSVLFGENGEFSCKQTKNFGFRSMDGSIYSYSLTKSGLSPIYIKRKVLDNLVNTVTIKRRK